MARALDGSIVESCICVGWTESIRFDATHRRGVSEQEKDKIP